MAEPAPASFLTLVRPWLATEIQRQCDAKIDMIAPTAKTHMTVYGGLSAPLLEIAGHGTYAITGTAHRQIGQRLGIPAKYYDRMPVESPDLLARSANEWLGHANESRMVRTLDGNMRANMSDRYQRTHNSKAEVAHSALSAILDARPVLTQTTEHRMKTAS